MIIHDFLLEARFRFGLLLFGFSPYALNSIFQKFIIISPITLYILFTFLQPFLNCIFFQVSQARLQLSKQALHFCHLMVLRILRPDRLWT